jgi:septum formation topological specificity factor MinE
MSAARQQYRLVTERVAVFRLTTEVLDSDALTRLRNELWAVAQKYADDPSGVRLRQAADTWELPPDEAKEWLSMRPRGWKPAG